MIAKGVPEAVQLSAHALDVLLGRGTAVLWVFDELCPGCRRVAELGEVKWHRISSFACIPFGGLPLLYMGDEIGLTNDYNFAGEPAHAHDNRWMHRPKMNWAKPGVPQSKLLDGTKHIFRRRKALGHLAAGNPTKILESGNLSIFAFLRESDTGPLLAIFNFSELWQNVPAAFARGQGIAKFHDALSDAKVLTLKDQLQVPPYGRIWLV